MTKNDNQIQDQILSLLMSFTMKYKTKIKNKVLYRSNTEVFRRGVTGMNLLEGLPRDLCFSFTHSCLYLLVAKSKQI